jgi:hypothetical protein
VGLRRGVLLREVVLAVVVQPGPLMALRSARPVALRQERAEAARPAVPVGYRGANLEAQHRAHLSAAAARRVLQAAAEVMAAQRPAEPVVAQRLVAPAVQAAVAAAVQQAQEVPLASAAQPQAAAVWDVAAGLRPAGSVAVVRLPEEGAAVLDVAEAALPQVAEAALPQAAAVARAAAAGVRRREEVARAAGVPRRAARGGAVLLLAAAWAALPSTRLQGDRLAPSARARSARARRRLRTAQP